MDVIEGLSIHDDVRVSLIMTHRRSFSEGSVFHDYHEREREDWYHFTMGGGEYGVCILPGTKRRFTTFLMERSV